uniref:Mediator of RNA polymerase II transcription subunit 6 n=1 Tax=Gongylonema pulchrum TaxID=637853 RepID=A0A183D7Y8_9BILA
LIGIVDSLRMALEQARQYCRYSAGRGYYWEFKESEGETTKKAPKEEEKPQLARSTYYHRTRTDPMLRELFAKFPPPDNIGFNYDESEASAEADATAAGGSAADKSAPTASITGQDAKPTEDASSAAQKATFASPSSVPMIPPHRSAGEASGGPLSFPGTAPPLSTPANPPQETDFKRFKTG